MSASINAQQYEDRYGKVSDIYYEDNPRYADIQYEYDDRYYEDDRYYLDDYPPKDKKPKKVVCKDTGFIVDNFKNCPIKCPDGLFVMKGMECPMIPEKPIVCPNGIVVDDLMNCPQKCETTPFTGFYVMDATTQCMPDVGAEKSDEAICEFCINLSTQSLQSGVQVLVLGNSTNAYVNEGNGKVGAWGICSEEDPVETFSTIIENNLTGNNEREALGLWEGIELPNGDRIIGCMEAAGFTNG
ncbi:MAG: hypothetical protein ACPKQO_06320 [Nitrososphaeraceae archaeon]